MSETTIVPFADAAARRAHDAEVERMKDVAANPDRGNPNLVAIETLLRAMEGMQAQIAAMTEVIVQMDARLSALEKPKIIKVRS